MPAWQKILIAIACLLSPLSLLTLLMAFSCVNPMGIGFLTEFTIVNETSEELSVTPIGAIGRDGQRSPLPYSRFRNLVVLSSKVNDFQIAAHSDRSFVYDWDDIQFCEILVRNKAGVFRVLPTGLHPTQGQYRQTEVDRFVITNFDDLEAATETQLAALNIDRGKRVKMIYGLAALGLIPPVLFCFMLAVPRNRAGV